MGKEKNKILSNNAGRNNSRDYRKRTCAEERQILGKFYVQKTKIAFRKAAAEKLKKIGPYGDVEHLVDPSTLEKADRQWGRYNQGITFDEENLESLIKDKLFKDKDQAKISK